ncbi:hypothetical protein AB6C61_05875 [Vibrio splendidus]
MTENLATDKPLFGTVNNKTKTDSSLFRTVSITAKTIGVVAFGQCL